MLLSRTNLRSLGSRPLFFALLGTLVASLSAGPPAAFDAQDGPGFQHDLGSQELRPAKGRWLKTEDTWQQTDAAAYDLACFAEPLLTGHYTLTAEIRHSEGAGGGFIFHSEKPEGPWHGEMIRFESPSSLLQGYFVRGEFVCRKVLRLPAPIDPAAWNELRLDIDGEAKRVAIRVNDQLVAEGLTLTYSCGRAALQSSQSVAEFRGFRAEGTHAASPGLAWPRRAVLADGGALLQSPALQRSWWIAAPDAMPELRPGWEARTPAPAPEGYELQPGHVEHHGTSFAASEVAPFDPVALFEWEGSVWAVDLAMARLVEVPRGGGGELSVRFPAPGRARVELRAGGELRFERELEGLAPGSRHSVEIPRSYRTIPAAPSTREIAFTTPPKKGLHRARRIRVLAVICGNVFDNVVDRDEDWPEEEYARIRRELEVCREWYWVQSGFRLLLDVDYLHEERALDAAGLTSEGKPYGRPRTEFIHEWAKEAGHDIEHYQSVLVIQSYRHKAPNASRWRQVGRGGGLTLGAHGRGHGLSWWFVPEQTGYNAWLFCHEFHHQLDALFEISGHPEYWFNHFSPTIGTAANFGEHWDGNAHILREWPSWQWDALRFGDDVLLTDADGDAFPDDAPETPMDEKRFGSSPGSADTDGDGRTDLQEILMRRTVEDSGFEVWGPGHAAPDPNSADSDGDGTGDAEDPLPLAAYDPVLVPGEWRQLRKFRSPHLRAEAGLAVRARREGDAYELDIRFEGFTREDRSELRLLLDLGADGWFVGRDNAEVQFQPFRSGARPAVRFQDAAKPGEWPHDAPELAKDFPLEARGGEGELVLTVRPSARHGFTGRAGSRVQFVAAVRSVASRRAGLGWITFFEPHVLMPLQLPPE